MKSFRVLGHQAKYIGAAFVMLAATFTPLFVTQTASAAQLTDRSVQLTNSSKGATGVDYAFTFTSSAATTDAGVLVEFCSNSPLVGDACTAPGNSFSVSGSNVTGGTKVGTWTANRVEVEKTLAASTNTFTITGVANPTVAGTVYARVVTYGSAGAISTNTTVTPGTHIDEGAVAFSVTDTIGLSGSVREELTFCVSGTIITDNCASGLSSTALELGETVGTSKALSATAISTADVYTQLSTNALSGAVVRIKNTSNTCGGLNRAGETTCDIAAAGASWATTAVGEAKFGVLVDDAAAADLGSPLGTLTAATGSDYGDDHYALNQAGVISTYGDPLLDTGGQLAAGKVVKLTFGASITPGTPAGRYSADLSLVATGTF